MQTVDVHPQATFHDAAAFDYDSRIRMLVPGYAEIHRVAAAALRGRLPRSARILVVGAGTGTEIIELSRASSGWSFAGVEPSAVMLTQAEVRCATQGLATRSTFANCTLEEFSETVTFDAATVILVSHFVPDDGARERHYAKLRRHVAPGGAVVLAEILLWPEFDSVQQTWRQLTREAGCSESDITMTEQRLESSFALITEHRLRELSVRAGFTRFERLLHFVNVGLYLLE